MQNEQAIISSINTTGEQVPEPSVLGTAGAKRAFPLESYAQAPEQKAWSDPRAFKALWKQLHASGAHKPMWIEQIQYGQKVKIKQKGALRAVHYMIYNALRGHPLERGFDTTTVGYEQALSVFTTQQEHYKKYLSKVAYTPLSEHVSGAQWQFWIDAISAKVRT